MPSHVDAEHLRQVYERDAARLIGLATWIVGNPSLGAELVHDTFVHLVERPPHLVEHGALGSYVRRAVVNRSRSRIRRLVLERRHRAATAAEEPLVDDDPFVDDEVRLAVGELPRRQRECVVLRYYADLTVDDIATELGIGPGSVKTHLHRAHATLAARLEIGGHDDGD